MKKPKKKVYGSMKMKECNLTYDNILGYNQACDDWEKYHAALLKEIEGKLPKKKKLSMLHTVPANGWNAYRTEALKILREMLGGVR